mmetsp:Transcript_11513/g.19472  ORF Transcript_11513/g.19472 Transcript_11513/m.19472 type:complete len:311 (-) Transcript_11513:529-1461(-)
MEYQVKFRDVSMRRDVPFFVYDKEMYIAVDQERGKQNWTASERKQILQQSYNPYTFIVTAISLLSRSCIFTGAGSTRSCFSIDNLGFVPQTEELVLLQSQNNIKWWNYNFTKLARNSIALMFAHICHENNQFSNEYINFIQGQINNRDSLYIRQIERAVVRMLQIEDRYTAERTKRMLQKINDVARANTLFYVHMESIFELIFKVSVKSFIASLCLTNKINQDLTRFLERYLKENYTLPVGGNDKTRIFKEGQINWNEIKSNVLNQNKLDWISNYSKTRAQKFFRHIRQTEDDFRRICTLSRASDCLLSY